MSREEYWRRRFELLEARNARDAAQTLREVEVQFAAAQRRIDDQIRAWHSRFAQNNEISMVEARRLLRGRELAEFRWDVERYIRTARRAGGNPVWIRQLENASARFHISRLEALKLQTEHTLQTLFRGYHRAASDMVKRRFLGTYYRASLEVQRGVGVGWDIAGINEAQLQRVMRKPWTADGKTFSSRIWDRQQELTKALHTQLAQDIILGRSPDQSIEEIAAKFKTSKANAGRLVMTESAYFSSEADRAAFKNLGVESVKFLATLDKLTSDQCADMDGAIIPMSEYRPGVTVPPLHANCRSTTVPHVDGDEMLKGERIARDSGGKVYYIDRNTTYRQWEKMQPNVA